MCWLTSSRTGEAGDRRAGLIVGLRHPLARAAGGGRRRRRAAGRGDAGGHVRAVLARTRRNARPRAGRPPPRRPRHPRPAIARRHGVERADEARPARARRRDRRPDRRARPGHRRLRGRRRRQGLPRQGPGGRAAAGEGAALRPGTQARRAGRAAVPAAAAARPRECAARPRPAARPAAARPAPRPGLPLPPGPQRIPAGRRLLRRDRARRRHRAHDDRRRLRPRPGRGRARRRAADRVALARDGRPADGRRAEHGRAGAGARAHRAAVRHRLHGRRRAGPKIPAPVARRAPAAAAAHPGRRAPALREAPRRPARHRRRHEVGGPRRALGTGLVAAALHRRRVRRPRRRRVGTARPRADGRHRPRDPAPDRAGRHRPARRADRPRRAAQLGPARRRRRPRSAQPRPGEAKSMSAEARGWTIRRWLSLFAVVEAVLLLAAVAGAAIAMNNLTEARNSLLDVIGPQRLAATQLSTALLNQETGVRGYQLGRQPDFLAPYTEGRRAEGDAVGQLRQLGALPGTQAGDDLEAVLRAAATWQAAAAPAVEPGASPLTQAQIERGRTLFDAVRGALGTQFEHLTAVRDAGRADLDSAANFLTAMLVAVAVLVVLLFVVLFLGLRQVITRPILRLAGQVREVADQDVHRPVQGSGPREIAQLGTDVEAMRQRILDEVAELERAHAMLDRRTRELERSNADLEQFAYVASHDLQEPLRKVASFCQLLQRRYQGLLDERGEQYIEFAVDGAKRMQQLINDLLMFSRVGRQSTGSEEVDLEQVLAQALRQLEATISEAGAEVTHDPLPRIEGDQSLLVQLFQNLVGNGVKFRAEAPPRVHLSASRTAGDGDLGSWEFTCGDNGIGI